MGGGKRLLSGLVLVALACRALATSVEIAAFFSNYRSGGPNGRPSLYNHMRLTPAFDMAHDEIARRVESGEYANFSLAWSQHPLGCDFPLRKAVGVAADSYYLGDAVAFFGPTCSSNIIRRNNRWNSYK